MKICIVFVSNNKYLNKFKKTLNQLRSNGLYTGEVLLIIGDDLKDKKSELEKKYNIQIKYFPNIKFSDYFYKINDTVLTDGRNKLKSFQWHKMYLFDVFFKKWDYIFYMDCGMKILRPIQPILDCKKKNKLLAHNDAYPTYLGKWKLKIQFDQTQPLFKKLSKKYELNIDYFQTGLLLFDTNIIHDKLFRYLYKTACKYPISRTNEQGIMALYFINIENKWEQIKMYDDNQYYYDCFIRTNDKPYIMHKM